MNIGFVEFIMMPVFSIIPLVILYFVIKLAVKNAIKELKNENRL